MAAISLTLGPVSPQVEVEKALFLNMSGLGAAKGSTDDSYGIKKRHLGPFFEEGRQLKIDLVCSLGFCLKILLSFFGPPSFLRTRVRAGSCAVRRDAVDHFGFSQRHRRGE